MKVTGGSAKTIVRRRHKSDQELWLDGILKEFEYGLQIREAAGKCIENCRDDLCDDMLVQEQIIKALKDQETSKIEYFIGYYRQNGDLDPMCDTIEGGECHVIGPQEVDVRKAVAFHNHPCDFPYPYGRVTYANVVDILDALKEGWQAECVGTQRGDFTSMFCIDFLNPENIDILWEELKPFYDELLEKGYTPEETLKNKEIYRSAWFEDFRTRFGEKQGELYDTGRLNICYSLYYKGQKFSF